MTLEEEVKYLRFLVWKLSVRDLAEQHPKYRAWLKRTYVSTRAADFGVDDSKPKTLSEGEHDASQDP